jgi:hypothetical protein
LSIYSFSFLAFFFASITPRRPARRRVTAPDTEPVLAPFTPQSPHAFTRHFALMQQPLRRSGFVPLREPNQSAFNHAMDEIHRRSVREIETGIHWR